jgi:hypothetical protein
VPATSNRSPNTATGIRPTSISQFQREREAKEPSTTQSLRTGSATGSTIREPLGGHTREISRESEELARRQSEKLARRPPKPRNVPLGIRVMRLIPRRHRMTVRKYLPNRTRRSVAGCYRIASPQPTYGSRYARGPNSHRSLRVTRAGRTRGTRSRRTSRCPRPRRPRCGRRRGPSGSSPRRRACARSSPPPAGGWRA